jgi:integrase
MADNLTHSPQRTERANSPCGVNSEVRFGSTKNQFADSGFRNSPRTQAVDKPVIEKLEKPRVGRRDRVPTAAETEAILAKASPSFQLIYSALRQCGARPGELCQATIADVDRANRVITL